MFLKHKKATSHRRSAATREDDRVFPAMAKSVFFALLCALAVGLLLLFVTTAVLLSTKDPDRYRPAAGTALLFLTAALSGMLAAKFYGRRAPVLCGLFAGLCLLLLLSVLALCLPGEGASNRALAFLRRLSVIPFSLLGAALVSGRRKTRRRRR